jgi:parallel beta-helix repeat protein
MDDNSADYWYVHDNRVYNYYRESGMQFNGDNNLIEDNEIYKVSNRLDTPYGCQLLNILGHNNVIRGNTLSRLGSTAQCAGILFEWDLADANTVEQNLIFDVTAGIAIQGGDNNIIRNNIIYVPNTPEPHSGGIEIFSYDSFKTDWPCNEESGSAESLLPANNPAHPDYQYYYNPRNCHSFGNHIYNNVIHGFVESVHLYPLAGENTVIRNNVFSGWTRGSICYYISISWTCYPLPVNVTADHNADQGPFGFVDIDHFDFHLINNSPLIDTGLNLGPLNSYDFDGNPRPQGTDYDIGAYEYLFNTQP